MSYQRIRYFLKAAESGSFSAAAEKMYVSPQALTKQVGMLEEDIGGRLFERTSHGVSLTPLGREAYEKLSRIDRELDLVMEELKESAVGCKKKMSIGIFSSLPQEKLVTPLISFLLGTYVDYQINLNLVELEEGRQLLLQGKMDMLLTNTHEEDDWGDNLCAHLSEHEAKVIVSLYHPWALKQSISQEDMKKVPFLKMDMDRGHYLVPLADSFYENIPCSQIIPASNFNTLYALLQQGEAFAVFPRAFAYMDQAKIKCFDFPGRKFKFFTALIYNPGKSGNELGHVFKEIVEEYVSES